MKDILATRFMHWRKHWLSLIFWLVFPVLMTLVVVYGFHQMKDDAAIPVGVVTEGSSSETDALVEDIASTDFIRMVETDALSAENELKKHKLDSVFQIPADFSEQVADGRRHHLLESYQSDQSFAYVPVKEKVLSHVQEAFNRSHAAEVLDDLSSEYGEDGKWSREEIIQTSQEIEDEQDLLHVSLQMEGSADDSEDSGSMLDIWAIWASLNVLATLLLFDWVIHERHAGVRPRFRFMRFSFKHYLLLNAGLYVCLSLVFDAAAMVIIAVLFQTTVPIGAMLGFQVFLSLGAFLLAHLFKRPFVYYMAAFAITLVLAVGSGTILPNEGLIHRFPWLMQLNPLQPFLNGMYANLFSVIVVGLLLIWYVKRGSSDVTR